MTVDFRWLGLLSIAIIVVTAMIPLIGKPLDWQDSVSHSWTGSRRKWLLLAISMSAAGTCLCASLALWVTPHYHLPAFMYGVIALAYVAFMSVAWVPMTDRPGEHSFWHGHFLGASTLVTLAVVAMAAVVWLSTGVSSTTLDVCFTAMLLAACWPLLFFSPARRLFLALESLIAITFSAAIVLLFVG